MATKKDYPECFKSLNSRYTFTRPISKSGTFAEFFTILLDVEENEILYMDARDGGNHMTYQALRDTGLIYKRNRELVISAKGVAYIKYHLALHEGESLPDLSEFEKGMCKADPIMIDSEKARNIRIQREEKEKIKLELMPEAEPKVYKVKVTYLGSPMQYVHDFVCDTEQDAIDLVVSVNNTKNGQAELMEEE